MEKLNTRIKGSLGVEKQQTDIRDTELYNFTAVKRIKIKNKFRDIKRDFISLKIQKLPVSLENIVVLY